MTSARLTAQAELPELVGLIDGRASQTMRTAFSTEVLVEDSGIYLFRSHVSKARTDTFGRLLTLGRGVKEQSRTGPSCL